MRNRVKVSGAAAVLMVILGAAATAWACTSASGPYLMDPVVDRSAVGAPIQLSGRNWLPSSQVEVGWQTVAAGEVQPLATAPTDSSGAFTTRVVVPGSPSGIHYLAVTQGATTKLMPFELGSPAAATPAAAPQATPSPQTWIGMADSDTAARGLGDVPAGDGSGFSVLPVVGVGVAGTLLLAGLSVAELRRRRVQAAS